MAPVTDMPPSLVIAAHGERGGARADWLVHHLVERLAGERHFLQVAHAFISKPPGLDDVLASLPHGPVNILPLFMSDGYFATRAIPAAIARYREAAGGPDRQIHILTPAGLDPGLPAIIDGLACAGAEQAGHAADDVQAVLIAHGSRHDPSSRNATEQIAREVARRGSLAGVHTAYLEEAPFVDAVLTAVSRPAVAVGLFAGDGMHGSVDLPEAVEAARHAGELILAPPLTRSPAFIDLVCLAALSSARRCNQAAE